MGLREGDVPGAGAEIGCAREGALCAKSRQTRGIELRSVVPAEAREDMVVLRDLVIDACVELVVIERSGRAGGVVETFAQPRRANRKSCRIQIQNRLTGRADLRGWNHIGSGRGVVVAGAAGSCGRVQRRRRVEDWIGEHMLCALRLGGHNALNRSRLSYPITLAVDKEEGLVLEDRAADRAAELILTILSLLDRVEVVACIQVVVAEELERRTVELVCSGLRRN